MYDGKEEDSEKEKLTFINYNVGKVKYSLFTEYKF